VQIFLVHDIKASGYIIEGKLFYRLRERKSIQTVQEINILYLKQDDIQNLKEEFQATLDRDISCIKPKYNGFPRRKKHVSKSALNLALNHTQKKCVGMAQ
jgi:uncharacterized membrane-anchored protein YhcB (DUF1043 family)